MGYLSLLIVAMLAMGCVSSEEADSRVKAAIANRKGELVEACRKAGLKGLPSRLFLRAFKEERELEAWGAQAEGTYKLIRTYRIAGMSGKLGPKRKEGDLQVPEGVYRISAFNPKSRFHLSLGIDYPNASDRVLSDRDSPGSDIYIHGSRASIGCLAMTDEKIEEIYVLALNAKASGVPVHIFPAQITQANLGRLTKAQPQHAELWRSLAAIYDTFESTRRVPEVTIDSGGRYSVSGG